MSDFFLSAGIRLDETPILNALRWTSYTKAWNGCSDGLSWITARVDDPALWAPARDSASRTLAIVAGRFAFDEAEWAKAEHLPYEGGLAARLVLDRWLRGGARAVQELNGGGIAIVIDETTRQVQLWTDRLGFVPAFLWTGNGFVVCSHADVAALALNLAGQPCKFDPVTMAEFFRTGTATHPHSYWQGINQLDAGTCYQFEWGHAPRLKTQTRYWLPAYFDRPYLEDRGEIVERLQSALTSSVRKRTLPRLGNVALMLSSGADSRTALFAACDPSRVTCYTFYDEPNAELRGAQALAAAAGVRHIAHQRGKDEYFQFADEAIRISGGMWSMNSAHYGGVMRRVQAENPGVVLTGCYADYMLKGVAYNRRQRKLFGRDLPLYKLSEFDYQFHHPFSDLPEPWDGRTRQRLQARFAAEAGNIRAESIAEFRRISPIVRECDASGRLYLRRSAQFDVFLSDNEVVELFGLISPEQKVSGIPFGMAVSKIVGSRARDVRDNNYSTPVGAGELGRVLAFIRASLLRKIRGAGNGQPYDRDPLSVTTAGSWPHYPRVIKMSPSLPDRLSRQPTAQREFLFDLLGPERKGWSLDDWAERDSTLFMRYYTASRWLTQQSEALGSLAG